jgi:asparagine synthase (glutamine-hydrolysing)
MRRFDGAPPDPAVLERMCAALSHRGPDDDGLLVRGSVGFAHRRLSIIDVAGSPQPMASATGDRFVCFNGEILNYRALREELPYPYVTNGDTETLLALFDHAGPAGVERLRGQFAYGLYDERDDELWLFRDQLGILPLYTYTDRNVFLFASEIKAILAALPRPPAVDRQSLGDYLARRSVPAPWTMYEGIRKLPAGSMLRITQAGCGEPVRYWSPSVPERRERLRGSDAVSRLEELLLRAVERNMVADVPVGAYLSGGIDSGVIVALMRALRPSADLHTFSATFGDPRLDESPYAKQVARRFGTTHHHVDVSTDDFARLWPRLSWHRDGPISEASDVAVFRLAETAAEHVKVVLSGEGGDELFAGYPKHRFAGLTAYAGFLPARVRSPLVDSVERRLPPRAARPRVALRALAANTERDRMETWFAPFTRAERSQLLGGEVEHDRTGTATDASDPLTRMLLSDIDGWLPDNLLERGDRMTMAASVELRPPFLDVDLTEWALRLSPAHKIHSGSQKWVLRQLAARYLPQSVVRRPKIGFKVPLDNWFRGAMEPFVRQALLGDDSYAASELNRPAIERLVDRHTGQLADEGLRIWTLLSLEVWHRVSYNGDLHRLGIGHESSVTTGTR